MSQNRTESQRAAARANGAKSQGPTSLSGKRISSMNARKHGIYANTLVLPDENRDSFLRLCADLHLYFSPRDPLEDIFVHRMIAARWRSQRCQHFENAGITAELSRQGDHKEYALDGQVCTCPLPAPSTRVPNSTSLPRAAASSKYPKCASSASSTAPTSN